MARSPRGRSSIGQAAALALGALASDPSAAAATPPSAPQAQQPEPASSSQTLPDVTYGKTLNVPDNFLGAGYTGKGWTIDEAVMRDGKPVVKLHRRVKETGAIEEHEIDADTFKAAKEYKDEQGGMSKASTKPVLQKTELGRGLDPQGLIQADYYDAATKSYRLVPPSGQTAIWVKEEDVKKIKNGDRGVIDRVHKDLHGGQPSTPTTGQAIGGAVAGAIFGKTLATRLGLREKNQEQAPDRPSTSSEPTTESSDVSSQDRARQEALARKRNLERHVDSQTEDEEGEDEQDEGKDLAHSIAGQRTITYRPTNKPGESAQVSRRAPAGQASTKIETTTTGRSVQPPREAAGLKLRVHEATSPTAAANDAVSEAPVVSQVINQPIRPVPLQLNQQPTSAATTPSSDSGIARPPRRAEEKVDRVQETLARSEARKRRRQEAREKIGEDPQTETPSSTTSTNKAAALGGVPLSTRNGGAPASSPYRVVSTPAFGGGTGSSQLSYGISQPQGEQTASTTTTHVGSIEIPLDEGGDSVSIRQMRQLMQAQQQDRRLNLTTRARFSPPSSTQQNTQPLSFTASQSQRATRYPQLPDSNGGAAKNLGAALGGALASTIALESVRAAVQTVTGSEGIVREQALKQVRKTIDDLEARVQAMSVRLERPASTNSATPPPSSQPPTRSSTQPSSQPEPSISSPSSPTVSGRLTITTQRDTPQDLSLLQRSLGTLKNAEQQLSALPQNSAVPQGFSLQISGLEGLLGAAPEAANTEEEQAIQAFRTSFSSTPLASSAVSPEPFSPPPPFSTPQPFASPGVRVGAAPISRQTSAISPVNSNGRPLIGRSALGSPLSSAVNLDAAQAMERGRGNQGGGDARSQMLAADSSVPMGTNEAAPLSSGYTHSTNTSQDEQGNFLRTSEEDAAHMRRSAEATAATGRQFSGGSDMGDSSTSDTDSSEQTPETNDSQPLSPQEQFAAANQMQAAQGAAVQQAVANQTAAATTQAGLAQRTTSTPQDTPVQRLTKADLLISLIEGCMDILGFFRFLSDSTIALINDRYFGLSVGPSIKKHGVETRNDRYFRYGIFFADGMIFIFILMAAFTLVAVIVAMGSPLATAVRAVTPG